MRQEANFRDMVTQNEISDL